MTKPGNQKINLKGAFNFFGDNALSVELEAGSVNNCQICCSDKPKLIIPTYFFNHKPHEVYEPNSKETQVGFFPVPK